MRTYILIFILFLFSCSLTKEAQILGLQNEGQKNLDKKWIGKTIEELKLNHKPVLNFRDSLSITIIKYQGIRKTSVTEGSRSFNSISTKSDVEVFSEKFLAKNNLIFATEYKVLNYITKDTTIEAISLD